MKRPLYSPPEAFSLSPLMALLPTCGKVSRLEPLSASLYARYEKVAAIKRGSQGGGETSGVKRLDSEEAMLRQVLDWLAIRPDTKS